MKETFVSVLLAVGQLFFGHGLSTEVKLVCSTPEVVQDSLVFSSTVQDGQNKDMDQFLMTGLPLRMRIIAEIRSRETDHIMAQSNFYNEIYLDLTDQRFFSVHSRARDTLVCRSRQDAWTHFFTISRVAFPIKRLENADFLVGLRVFLERIYIQTVEKEFDPMVFWGNTMPVYQGPVTNLRHLPLRHQGKTP